MPKSICVWPEGPDACAAHTHGCFPCRLRYWREQGAPAVKYAGGRENWNSGQTVREMNEETIREAKRAGIDPVPATPKSRWV